MALRGKSRSPFYMVGRMERQSVVLRAEKGKLWLLVGHEEEGKVRFASATRPSARSWNRAWSDWPNFSKKGRPAASKPNRYPIGGLQHRMAIYTADKFL